MTPRPDSSLGLSSEPSTSGSGEGEPGSAPPTTAELSALPSKVILTGAGGWLGRRLVDALTTGLTGVPPFDQPTELAELRLLYHDADRAQGAPSAPSRAQVLHGDLQREDTRRALLKGAEGALLIHTAGVIHPRRVRDFDRVNHVATAELLKEAAAQGVRRAVVISSNSPIGCNPHAEHRFDEDAPFDPYLGYGVSKMAMERAVRSIEGAGALEAVIVRPPWFYGPYQPPRQTLFFEMIRRGRAPIVGSGENRRSMVYIDNLCQGVLRAARVPAARGRVYWIADAEAYTMNQIIGTVAELMESELGYEVSPRRLRLPHAVGELATLADRSLQALGIYQQKLHVLGEMNKHIAVSVARARRELGYEPTVSLREGMRQSLLYCVEQGLLPKPRGAARWG
ncbi:MAG: NAD(P)-dependent oxidoreductase [Polyangiaceae bacterium]|nr:NAD(P)-dependent oxidoreductase [Polyangiaceae bacterium]MCW5791255.1 NAD(P)-dependent oxidoreductase [Polyangiaceae bacterium]